MKVDEELALNYMLKRLRQKPDGCGNYGYDVYVPAIMRAYGAEEERLQWDDLERRIKELSPHFYAAAWELCRRGIIRPGIRRLNEQETRDGSAGNGYSLTPFGRTWLAESDRNDFVPTEPGRVAAMFRPFHELFGPGFYERTQEATRCYGAHAYLACCAMVGAAAESILLALAVQKTGDEDAVIRTYAAAGGRVKLEKMVTGQAKEHVQREFFGFTTLLKYWRDESAHGTASHISDNEAYTSVAMLLRFAIFVRDHWEELVGKK